MLQGVFVPVAVLVEHELLLSRSVSEAEFGVKHVDVPHEGSDNISGINLFEIANVNVVSVSGTEPASLVENDLLGVRKKFRVPAEVLSNAQFHGQFKQMEYQRHRPQESKWASEDGHEGGESESVVSMLKQSDGFSCRTLVKVDAVLMGLDAS